MKQASARYRVSSVGNVKVILKVFGFVLSAESKMAIRETMFFLILIMLPVSLEAKRFGKARSNIEIYGFNI